MPTRFVQETFFREDDLERGRLVAASLQERGCERLLLPADLYCKPADTAAANALVATRPARDKLFHELTTSFDPAAPSPATKVLHPPVLYETADDLYTEHRVRTRDWTDLTKPHSQLARFCTAGGIPSSAHTSMLWLLASSPFYFGLLSGWHGTVQLLPRYAIGDVCAGAGRLGDWLEEELCQAPKELSVQPGLLLPMAQNAWRAWIASDLLLLERMWQVLDELGPGSPIGYVSPAWGLLDDEPHKQAFAQRGFALEAPSRIIYSADIQTYTMHRHDCLQGGGLPAVVTMDIEPAGILPWILAVFYAGELSSDMQIGALATDLSWHTPLDELWQQVGHAIASGRLRRNQPGVSDASRRQIEQDANTRIRQLIDAYV